jgi:uncharacterized membrane protein YkvA (DUF1232 family)
MAKYIDRMKAWIDSFADDVDVVKKIVESDKAAREARELAAGSLNYLVTRMDLIPDWEETCGVIDDAMVLRVAIALGSEKDLGVLDGATTQKVGRLCNEAEVVHEFLGDVLYPKLKKYVQDQVGKEVRGRKAATIVDDAKQRKYLYEEIGNELKALPPAPISDPDAVERTILNYLKQKL